MPLAVNILDVATPLAFVTAVFTPPANVPLGPVPGAVNVTVRPFSGLPPGSVTVATKAATKAVLICALCPEPLVTTIDATGPGRFVSEKLTVVKPMAEAATT